MDYTKQWEREAVLEASEEREQSLEEQENWEFEAEYGGEG